MKSRPSSGTDIIRRYEPGVLAALLFSLFLLNIVTGVRCPTVMYDEMLWTDPAANMFLGKGFVSSLWYVQPPTPFWAGNVPLHPLLLYPWLKVFGFGMLAVRAFDYFLIDAAMLLLWFAIRRHGWISNPRWRLVTVALAASGYGVAYAYRMGRPDALCILLFCAGALVLTAPSQALRWEGAFLIGCLLPWAGLQAAAYSVILLVMILGFTGTRYRWEVVSILSGELTGASLLLALYAFHGVLGEFLQSAVGTHTAVGRMTMLFRLQGSRTNFAGYLKDPSFLVLLGLAFVVARPRAKSGTFRWKSFLGFGICSSFCIPLAVFFIGFYRIYYSWMAYLPLTICICATVAGDAIHLGTKKNRLLVTSSIVLAVLLGAPTFCALAIARWRARDPGQIERLASGALSRCDQALIDYSAYYGVKRRVRDIYADDAFPLSKLTPQERADMTVLVIRPESLSGVVAQLGGTWRDTGKGVHSEEGSSSQWFSNTKILESYNLEVYRRVSGGALPVRTRARVPSKHASHDRRP